MSSILNETDDKNNKNFIYDTSIVPEIIKDSEDEEELALKEDNSDDNDDVIALNGVYYDDCDDDNNCTLNVPSDEDVILWNDEPCSSKDFLKRKLNSNETLNNEKRFKIDDFASKFSDNDIPTDNAANYNDISKIEPVSETYYISEFSDDDDILDLTTEEFTFSTKKKQETEVIDLTGDEKLAFSIQQLDLELEKQRKLQEQQDAEYALKLSLELNAEIPVETALQRNKIENSNNLVYPILSNSSFDDTSKEKLKEIERTVPFDKQNASIAPPLVKREWGFKSTVSPIVPTEFPFHLNPLTQQRLKQARMDAAGKRALATETPVFLSASTLMQLPSIIPPTQKTYWTPTVNNLQRSSNADDMVDSDLKNLLSNVAHNENITPINRRLPTPALMTVTLQPHQQLGLEWMLKMENSSNKGGILADDMGLGKTIQTIALLLSNKPTSDGTNDITNQVLIICPKSLLNQWKEEMIDKTNYFTEKSIHIYHNDSPGGKEKNLKILKQYEVVITTYGAITSEWINEKKIEKASNAKKKNKQIKDFFLDEEADKTKKSSKRPANRLGNLFQINWWRIVLDEAHTIKNKDSNIGKAVEHLNSIYRWCLTGTLIQNKIDELFSPLRFLKIKPYCEWSEFSYHIKRPFSKKSGMVSATARNKVQTLVKAMCLSRKKTELLDGKPLVVLPERIVNVNVNQFDEDERNFYDVMFKRAQAKFNKFRREGTIMKNYSSVLVLLLRLRQCCCHPSLATVFGDQIVAAAGDIVELEKLLLDGMPNDVVQRVINNNEQMECPVCFDAIDHANGKIIQMCGHCFCNECCDNLLTSTRLCPHCRGNMERDKILTLHSFLKKYNPSALKNEEEYLAKEEVVKKEDELLKKNDWVSSTKIEALISCIKKSMETNADDKIIVFSQFVGFLDLIELPLRKLGIKYVRYDGSMSTKTRSEAVEQLKKDKETRLILISLKCGSLGLNLTCANRVILMDVWWNPAIENQAIDRAHRMGQTKDVYVERIVIQNSIEDRILELQTQKQQLSDGIMGHGEFGNQRQTRLSIDQLMRLFRDQDA